MTPGDKSNATTSPDTTMVCLKAIPVTKPKVTTTTKAVAVISQPTDDAIKLVENEEPSSIEQVYLIGGGGTTFEKKSSAQGKSE